MHCFCLLNISLFPKVCAIRWKEETRLSTRERNSNTEKEGPDAAGGNYSQRHCTLQSSRPTSEAYATRLVKYISPLENFLARRKQNLEGSKKRLLSSLKSGNTGIRTDLTLNCVGIFSSGENHMKINLFKRSEETAALCILTAWAAQLILLGLPEMFQKFI